MPKEEIQNLALRRNLYFPSGEIYPGAMGGFWEFGPKGANIRRKIVDFWRKELIEKEGFLEIFGSQILPEAVFEASGHLKSFNDPIVQCTRCHSFIRADKLLSESTGKDVPESTPVPKLKKLLKEANPKCPKCAAQNWSELKLFNMMMQLGIGVTGEQKAYLRPETCQSIFLDFPRIYKGSRLSLPMGIAQAGSSFRNEINPRNTLLRAREFGQMEIEIFFNPKKINEFERFDEVKNYKLNLFTLKEKKVKPVTCADAVKKKIVSGQLIAYYLARVQQLYEKYGIPTKKMRFRELEKEDRAFYAIETWDFEVETDLDWIELIACNYRSDYDLSSHSKGSKQDLSIKENGDQFMPHVFELSAGIDRTFYVVLDNAFKKERRGSDERIFLKLPPRIAPHTLGVFPLVKKDGLLEKAREIFQNIESHNIEAVFDEKGSIGRRYARIDEVGVPFAITIDYETMEKDTVTLRERDSLDQKRIPVKGLPELLWKLSVGITQFEKLK